MTDAADKNNECANINELTIMPSDLENCRCKGLVLDDFKDWTNEELEYHLDALKMIMEDQRIKLQLINSQSSIIVAMNGVLLLLFTFMADKVVGVLFSITGFLGFASILISLYCLFLIFKDMRECKGLTQFSTERYYEKRKKGIIKSENDLLTNLSVDYICVIEDTKDKTDEATERQRTSAISMVIGAIFIVPSILSVVNFF